ncbi:MAG: DUF4167 domain-containing protein [Parvularculaceae bacterium]|nr:DUF4167 domain-containing protein [Parvularculaceae bacterium]
MNGHFNKRGRNQRRRQGVNPNRALDSNGPDVRIRGTAQQIYDKYQALARDATSSGDRVKAENYLQHAEHYFRLLRSIQGPQTPAGDQTSNDIDADSDQPSIGEMREQRQQPAPAPADADNGADAANETKAGDAQSGETRSNGAAQAESGDGSNPEKSDQDGRRRKRRPRRPRADAPSASADEDSEPASA